MQMRYQAAPRPEREDFTGLRRQKGKLLLRFFSVHYPANASIKPRGRLGSTVLPGIEGGEPRQRKVTDVAANDREVVVQRCCREQPVDYR